MSTTTTPTAEAPRKHRPYVPETMEMKEFTFRAVLIGLVLTGVLGSANAYLGLKAGMTIAATYPAAVIGMALLRLMKGSLLEENIARTVGSIGESVAAGAIFTIPAFVMADLWPALSPDWRTPEYWKSVALMMIGGTLGILFVTLLRRVMVEDPDLPYPESVAASEIHKAGQQGSTAAKILFANMGFGGFMYLLGAVNIFSPNNTFNVTIGNLGKKLLLRTSTNPNVATTITGGATLFTAPDVSPAYLGVGYIIGPRLAALNFAGGVLAWGLLVPLLTFTIGPYIQAGMPAGQSIAWPLLAQSIYFSIVQADRGRRHARWSLLHALQDAQAARAWHGPRRFRFKKIRNRARRHQSHRTGSARQGRVCRYRRRVRRDDSALPLLHRRCRGIVLLAGTCWFVGRRGRHDHRRIFLCRCLRQPRRNDRVVQQPRVGPHALHAVIAALLMVALGVSGTGGVAAVLGVAAVVCVSSAVAGEMLQDLKVGHILGGTPAKMQIGDLLGIVVASLVLFFPIAILAKAYHFGSAALPAPQAGLMAMLSKGIVGGDMAWPLVIVGILLGLGMIMIEVKSVMLFAVGMYLPLGTTFAIFVGGIIRWITDKLRDRRGYNDAQKARVENAGVLTASGMIAGEALCGLVIASLVGSGHDVTLFQWTPPFIVALIALGILAIVMIRVPLANAGRPEDPAPPTAIM